MLVVLYSFLLYSLFIYCVYLIKQIEGTITHLFKDEETCDNYQKEFEYDYLEHRKLAKIELNQLKPIIDGMLKYTYTDIEFWKIRT